MFYDSELSRWVVEGQDEWYSMRCGEIVQFHTNRKTIRGRLVLGRKSWYILIDNVAFALLENQRYTVSIQI